MKIEVDAEARQILMNICDAALKYGGVTAFNGVGLVIRELEKAKETNPPKKEEGD